MPLRIYSVVLELVRALAPRLRELRRRSPALGDQLERALASVPLNLAEGAYSRGRNRQARYHTALGSAREALACFETGTALGYVAPLEPELVARFNQVIGTLVRLAEPKPQLGYESRYNVPKMRRERSSKSGASSRR